MTLHVYSLGPDVVVAESIDEAFSIWEEHTGEKRASYNDDQEFCSQKQDESQLSLWFNNGANISMTCAEWAEVEGRGFLGTDEW